MLPPRSASVNTIHTPAGEVEYARLSWPGLGCEVTRLRLARSRVFWKQRFDCFGSFDAALLLKFSNPIGYSLNHFTRGLSSSGPLSDGLFLTIALVLLDDSDWFLF